jgi:hypothetical protein
MIGFPGRNTLRMKAVSDIGSMLLRLGVVSEDQLRKAVEAQLKNHHDTRLGEMLVKLGYVTEEQVTRALKMQKLMRSHRASEVMSDIVSERLDRLELLLAEAR